MEFIQAGLQMYGVISSMVGGGGRLTFAQTGQKNANKLREAASKLTPEQYKKYEKRIQTEMDNFRKRPGENNTPLKDLYNEILNEVVPTRRTTPSPCGGNSSSRPGMRETALSQISTNADTVALFGDTFMSPEEAYQKEQEAAYNARIDELEAKANASRQEGINTLRAELEREQKRLAPYMAAQQESLNQIRSFAASAPGSTESERLLREELTKRVRQGAAASGNLISGQTQLADLPGLERQLLAQGQDQRLAANTALMNFQPGASPTSALASGIAGLQAGGAQIPFSAANYGMNYQNMQNQFGLNQQQMGLASDQYNTQKSAASRSEQLANLQNLLEYAGEFSTLFNFGGNGNVTSSSNNASHYGTGFSPGWNYS